MKKSAVNGSGKNCILCYQEIVESKVHESTFVLKCDNFFIHFSFPTQTLAHTSQSSVANRYSG
jgi:hypothetical protein